MKIEEILLSCDKKKWRCVISQHAVELSSNDIAMETRIERTDRGLEADLLDAYLNFTNKTRRAGNIIIHNQDGRLVAKIEMSRSLKIALLRCSGNITFWIRGIGDIVCGPTLFRKGKEDLYFTSCEVPFRGIRSFNMKNAICFSEEGK